MRVIVAEDGVLLREGLVRILAEDGYEVVAGVGTGPALLEADDTWQPELVVTDVRMPPTSTDEGIVAAATIRARRPGTAVVLLSQYVEAARAVDLFQQAPAGLGYLLKDRVLDIEEFLASVRRVASGGSAVDPEVVSQLLGGSTGPPGLSDGEQKVLVLMAEGLSNSGIAQRLVVSVRTVESYVGSILRKMGIASAPEEHRRVRAVLAYLSSR